MAEVTGIRGAVRLGLDMYGQCVRWLVYGLLAVSGVALLAMIVITTWDVVMRALWHPLSGAYDLICMSGTLTIACSLPYTTAVKGHVAIEYFFLKLRRTGRIVLDTVARLIVTALFVFFTWECVRYGNSLRETHTVATTLKMPIFWILYVMAFSCGVVVLVKIYHLARPGKAMIQP